MKNSKAENPRRKGLLRRGGGYHHAFTMAEILLSLTIIGVVAAITLPSLTGNINERTWNTQRKALYARFSQAIALMPALNSYGTFDATNDTAAETFVTEGLSKVLKINNICDAEHLQDCGIVTSFTNIAGVQTTFPTKISELNSAFTESFAGILNGASYDYINPQKDINTKAAAFETQNGESIAVFYNPSCQGSAAGTDWYYAQTKMCANFIYDLNGNKGPNTVGKDIGFMSALYSTDPVVVAPLPLPHMHSTTSNSYDALNACKTQDSESRLPNIEEANSMFYNKLLLGYTDGASAQNGFWTGTASSGFTPARTWYQNMAVGGIGPYPRDENFGVWCIKR